MKYLTKLVKTRIKCWLTTIKILIWTCSYLCTNLVPALAGLDVHNLPHDCWWLLVEVKCCRWSGEADLLTDHRRTDRHSAGWVRSCDSCRRGESFGTPFTFMIGCCGCGPGADWLDRYSFHSKGFSCSKCKDRKKRGSAVHCHHCPVGALLT